MKIGSSKSLTLHPFLLAIFPFLFVLSSNVEELSKDALNSLLIALVVTVCLVLLLWLLFGVIIRDKIKASLIISLGLVLFFSYGRFTPLVYRLWMDGLGGNIISFHTYFFMVWGIIFLGGTYFFIRTRRNLNILTNLLNIVAVTLVLISLFGIGDYYILRGGSNVLDDNVIWNANDSTLSLNVTTKSPDIYYIILDSYASSATLSEVYNYDNHEFYDYLDEKGFMVANESYSNYPYTFMSLASSLNMVYLDNLTDIVGIGSSDPTVPLQMIEQNTVMRLLKSSGYKFIHLSSGWDATNSNKFADLNIMCGGLNEAQNVLIQTTMLGPFFNYFVPDNANRVLETFSQLSDMSTIEGPKFVFSHIMCPHAPYVFDENGQTIPIEAYELTSVSEQKERYLHQLMFITSKIEMLVDYILSESETKPIIIIQSDHGPASLMDFADTFPNSPSENMLKERFGILNAYYLPQGGDKLLYDSITPVNTFRLIFNFYFGTEYELLDDHSHYSNYGHYYDFVDVTGKLRNIEGNN